MTEADFIAALTAYGVTPENILYVFSWGMGVVLMSWSVGFAVGVGIKMINKV
ncbi:MAG: hypothetical protein L3J28_04450 [Candidatus Polarisedimenticolaceae bacterium]|nr:hypothetical protein [Candidatus Polarisedimenticolaceae bacterium]